MTLTSEWYEIKRPDGSTVRLRNIWNWAPQDDGAIKNWGFIQRDDENAELRKYFDIVYRKNAIGSAAKSEIRK
ncbi:MAG: hypothetical protein GC152_03595 [Alphaproteobacteria bacterium]|nr:hypothetical protein [Alphaproteobacteria bacterium]